MAGIKSVKTSSGARVQIGSKAYNRRVVAGGESITSGTGKNLSGSDIRSLQKSSPGYADEVSTTRAKREANAKGQLLPYQQEAPTAIPEAPQDPTQAPETPAMGASAQNALKNMGYANADPLEVQGMQEEINAGDLKSKYTQGLQTIKQTTPQAPSQPGIAMGMAQGALTTPQQEPESILGGMMETDNNFDSIFTMFDEIMSPTNQKVSLVEEYQKLSQSLGIEDINAELIDAKRVIEGTEDDIRAEITATGGFGTESQVQALANARNKSLIKNYNSLLDTRDNAMQQLDTMMNLSMQDRKSAEAEFDRKLNFAFKVQEFQERATTNARNTYMTLGDKMGWDTLLTQVSPYERGIMQKTLGLSDTALTGLATASATQRLRDEKLFDLDVASKQSNITTNQLQQEKLRQEISDGKAGQPTILQAKTLGEAKNGLSQFTDDKDIPASVREQIRKGIVIMNKLNELVEDTPDGNFAGGRLRAFAAPFIPGGAEPKFQKLKSDESKIRQDLVTYITGAAYTSLQEGDVNKIIPRSQLYDNQNQQRVTNLANTVLGDIESALIASGINAQLPRFDDLFMAQMMGELSPEQEQQLRSEGLIP